MNSEEHLGAFLISPKRILTKEYLMHNVMRLVAGPIYMYSPGHMPVLLITDVEMVKEIGLCTSLNLGKPSYLSKDKKALLYRPRLTHFKWPHLGSPTKDHRSRVLPRQG